MRLGIGQQDTKNGAWDIALNMAIGGKVRW